MKGNNMEYINLKYEQQLRDLAHLLCPLTEVVKINPLSIPRGDDEELSQNRWDDMGRYVVDL